MLRIILGVIVGAVAGMAVVYGVELLGHNIWPLPAGVDLHDPEQLKTLMHRMPLPAIAWVLLGWGLGQLAGAGVALAVAKGRQPAGWIVVGLLFAAGVAQMVMIPHPLWFMVGSVVVAGVAGWLADRVFGKKA